MCIEPEQPIRTKTVRSVIWFLYFSCHKHRTDLSVIKNLQIFLFDRLTVLFVHYNYCR
jgi:hypothetical protein